MSEETASGAENTTITKTKLDNEVRYFPVEGYFIRLKSKGGKKAGTIAGYVHKHLGYVEIKVNGQSYYAHRLAHLSMTGEMPPAYIDHINGYRADNRWTNLRPASASENQLNRPGHGSSGLKNIITYDTKKFGTRYRVMIKRDGERIDKLFSDLDHAIACRDEWLRKFAGPFAHNGHIHDL